MPFSITRITEVESNFFSLQPLYEFPSIFETIHKNYYPHFDYQLVEVELINEKELPTDQKKVVKNISYLYELFGISGDKKYLLLVGSLDDSDDTFFAVVAAIYEKK